MTLFALIVGLPWSIAAHRDFHGGWFVYACVMTPLMVVGLVLRQLGISPLTRRQSR